jgi:hypothetical protein
VTKNVNFKIKPNIGTHVESCNQIATINTGALVTQVTNATLVTLGTNVVIMYVGGHVECLVFLSDFNNNWNRSFQ